MQIFLGKFLTSISSVYLEEIGVVSLCLPGLMNVVRTRHRIGQHTMLFKDHLYRIIAQLTHNLKRCNMI